MDISKLKRAAARPSAFVEIGHGNKPAFEMLKKLPLVDQLYLGLDVRSEGWPENSTFYNLRGGRERISAMRKQGKKCYWSYFNDQDMVSEGFIPLGDSSVESVFMCMVTNDPRIVELAPFLLLESARILAPGGDLIIVNSPENYPFRDPGDIFIDFDSGSFGMYGYGRDRFELLVLSSHFNPRTSEEHMDMLDRYGSDMRFVPGVDFSVLSRNNRGFTKS